MHCFRIVCIWMLLIAYCSLSNKRTQQTAIAHKLTYKHTVQLKLIADVYDSTANARVRAMHVNA